MSKDIKIIILSLVLLALVGGAVYFFVLQKAPAQSIAALKEKAEKFINEKMLPAGSDAKIKDMVEENGLYKLVVTVQGQDLTAYISKDGKNFFPDAYNMDSGQTSSGPTPSPQNVVKTDIPEVELFVMSYCPYGLQMEKGILPVIELLGSKINFNLKFVSYAMHGEKEIDENLRQYCIQQQGFEKLDSYLKCFVKNGNADTCLKEAKIDTAALNKCVSETDTQFKIKENFNDQKTWANGQFPPFNIFKDDNVKYSIGGSPSLVINGTLVSAQRDSQSLLNLICSAFSTQPDECKQQLSGDTPSASFGEGTAADSNSNAGCAN